MAHGHRVKRAGLLSCTTLASLQTASLHPCITASPHPLLYPPSAHSPALRAGGLQGKLSVWISRLLSVSVRALATFSHCLRWLCFPFSCICSSLACVPCRRVHRRQSAADRWSGGWEWGCRGSGPKDVPPAGMHGPQTPPWSLVPSVWFCGRVCMCRCPRGMFCCGGGGGCGCFCCYLGQWQQRPRWLAAAFHSWQFPDSQTGNSPNDCSCELAHFSGKGIKTKVLWDLSLLSHKQGHVEHKQGPARRWGLNCSGAGRRECALGACAVELPASWCQIAPRVTLLWVPLGIRQFEPIWQSIETHFHSFFFSENPRAGSVAGGLLGSEDAPENKTGKV